MESPTPGLFAKHPALALTLAYGAISITGLLFSWSLFRQFDINIFNYMEVGDFMLAALREPLTFLLSAGAVAFYWVVYQLGQMEVRWAASRKNKGRLSSGYARWSRFINTSIWAAAIGVVLYAYLFLSLYAEWKSKEIRAGRAPMVTVFVNDAATALTDGPMALLGSTSRFIFLYDPPSENTHIVPYENVAMVTPVAKATPEAPVSPEQAPAPAAPTTAEP